MRMKAVMSLFCCASFFVAALKSLSPPCLLPVSHIPVFLLFEHSAVVQFIHQPAGVGLLDGSWPKQMLLRIILGAGLLFGKISSL